MTEAIRLVVWDLDETFWLGTLTEGGIREYVRRNHDAVIELARRGIMSSICSKNDPAAVRQVLEEHGIWDYFIFPSIAWTPKAPRLRALIEEVQLRPSTVLFVDDNALNLEEAKHYIPGIQVANEQSLPGLLDDPRLVGKDDAALERLAQYKVLEKKKVEREAQGGDTTEFLRQSRIIVRVTHDFEAHLDRAIEVINRTNQLNFTKKRLPEELDLARAELRELVNRYNIQAGLVHVRDRYGDYGIVGLYVERKSVEAGSGLIHYCFSCRTLGMDIETWLYRRLGRPALHVVGDVLTDVKGSQVVDWVELEDGNGSATDAKPTIARAGAVRLRGGCELLAISHYLSLQYADAYGEFAFNRDHIQVRIEHTAMLCAALNGAPPEMIASVEKLGFRREDFQTKLFEDQKPESLFLFAFWADPTYGLYRHRRHGWTIPFNAYPAVKRIDIDLTSTDVEIDADFRGHWIVDALKHLSDEYEFAGVISLHDFECNLRKILGQVAPGGRAVLLGANDLTFGESGSVHVLHHVRSYNDVVKRVAETAPGAVYIAPEQYVRAAEDLEGNSVAHFRRHVYHRIYELVSSASAKS